LDGLANGKQTTKTYTSDTIGHSINVLVDSVEWIKVEADVTTIFYTINLIEGDV
jgi:hypothetical protein